MSTARVFTAREWGYALVGAALIQVIFICLIILFGDTRGAVVKEKPPEVKEIPIAVQPVLDELPLLKLGSKDKVKPKLPDMWQKREPTPVKRYEERSAPSAEAEDSVDKIPESKLADKEHEAPPEDAEIVKEVDQQLEDPEEEIEKPEFNQDGAEDGSEQGTETDPLKARQIDLYRSKIATWFNGRFTQPTESIPCATLKKLSALVTVQVGGNRNITSFSISQPSGNAIFDARVQSTMSALIGQQLPPPPPLYPDILGTALSPRLSGQWANCQDTSPPPGQAPAPAPAVDPVPTPPTE